ncbi:50S ribosomal protein L11 methyltransferase [Thiorhodococcus mannitoliphagus]|uniref:Ribosomal protein L11 methyltransferase n=1 Tax=Thiorhodococcus mannitoliphagus TaxID=329406 RepID=A0A6P1DR75_9GAMM|nr:50S ribosomal protein L11 methyltransferase [Thiorhodococcus mannitoliphagus]NEX20389.1 50S ribosomal protein L11 methyltransferase [Thiorhodococcus mannitoliphagus]
MPWLQLKFRVPRAHAESTEAALEAAGALSVTLLDAGDEPQLEPGPGETPLWSEILVSALFEADPASQALVERLAASLTTQTATPPTIERIEDQAWERVWLDDFKPTCFGKRLWVCPHGQPPEAKEAIVVWLDPGLAFGTGHHPTTAMCLAWLDGADLAGKKVLDFGCGSGILAIAALKLGAARAVAIDHDPQALEATGDNAAANAVAERMEIYLPDAAPDTTYDVVLANILAGPLVSLAPKLISHLRPGAALVLSGVLAEQEDAVCAAYRDRVELDPTKHCEDWVCMTGLRKLEQSP